MASVDDFTLVVRAKTKTVHKCYPRMPRFMPEHQGDVIQCPECSRLWIYRRKLGERYPVWGKLQVWHWMWWKLLFRK